MKRTVRRTELRPDSRRDARDEIRFHLEMRTQEFIDQGMSPEEARRAAAATFGDVTAIETELTAEREIRRREHARRDWMRGVVLDAVLAARSLRKHPAFALAAILTLALGIGAAASIFTVVNGVLLRPLPYASPDRLAMIWLHGDGVRAGERWPLSSGLYLDLTARQRAFDKVAAFRSWSQTLGDGEMPEEVSGARVTPSLFEVLGVRPALGRAFSDAEGLPGGPRVAILSHGLWQRRFGGVREVVGRTISMGGDRVTVVGVMPESFAFPRGAELPSGLRFGLRTEIWTPLVFSPADQQNYGTQNLAMIARRSSGVSMAMAEQDLRAALGRILATLGVTMKLGVGATSLKEQAAAPVRQGLLILVAGVALVLLVACFNVANLLLARTVERQRELAVRTALGARRGRVMRQLVTENLVLGLGGGVLGALLSLWGARLLVSLVPGSLPRADDVTVDWAVLALTLGVSLLTGVLLGVASAVSFAGSDVHAALHTSGARTTSGGRRTFGRRTMVAAEVAFSVVLLVAAGMLVLSFARLQRVAPGFTPDGALVARLKLPIPEPLDIVRDGVGWARSFDQYQQRLEALPGVIAVGATSAVPLGGEAESSGFTIEGRPLADQSRMLATEYSVVHGDYFRAAGVRLLEGRVFDRRDALEAPRVVIVNQALARRYFENESPVGQRIRTGFDFTPGAREIVGVVDNVKLQSLEADDVPQVYVPELQLSYPALSFVVRTQGEPREILPLLQRELKAISPALALSDVRPLRAVFDESLERRRFSLLLIGAFAWAALALSVIGLYGVVAVSVSQRRKELGVRIALGATSRDIVRLVLREGAAMAVVGIVIGVVSAFAAARVMRGMLFGVTDADRVVYVVAATLVAVTALAATYIPARRATRVEPTVSLRMD